MDRAPRILCSLYLIFRSDLEISKVIDSLLDNDISIIEYRLEPQTKNHSLRVLHIDYKEFWEISDALSELFKSMDDNKTDALSRLLIEHGGNAILDIAFYYYGTYPALLFTGKNMEIIRALKADISIDAY